MLQFGKLLYVMVRRSPNNFVDECLWYFKFLCVVYMDVNTFTHKLVKELIHKTQKTFWNHHKPSQTAFVICQCGKCHLEKKD